MPHGNDVTRRTLPALRCTGDCRARLGIKSRWGQTVSRPPNIVFIMADDLGYADVSCYGRPDFSTPNIDRLAAKGVRFLQAYANSAVCSATRTALTTGRYQYRRPLGLEEPLTGRDVGLPPEHPILPSLLKQAGYGTTLVGKWHLGALSRFGPLQRGYDLLAGSCSPGSNDGSSGNQHGTGCQRYWRLGASHQTRHSRPTGSDLLPVLALNAAPIPRKLFWRYKANAHERPEMATTSISRFLTTRCSSTLSTTPWSPPT